MNYALDIETDQDAGLIEDEALDAWRNKITCIGVVDDNDTGVVYRDWTAFAQWLGSLTPNDKLITHGGKFDFKTLIAKGFGLRVEQYVEDTMLQAVALSHKIPERWLEQYEALRKEVNSILKTKKDVHRKAGPYSLKTLAPHRLAVQPFWEPEHKDNDDYVLTDARYTLRLWHEQNKLLKEDGTFDFYQNKLMPWARMLLKAELTGVAIDFKALEAGKAQAAQIAAESSARLHEMWKPAYIEWHSKQVREVQAEYAAMTQAAIEKKVDKPQMWEKIKVRYDKLRDNAIAKIPHQMNLASPPQLLWILKDFYGLDVTDFEEDETTGRSVLNRLAEEGRKDVEELLKFRQASKLATAFFPSYESMAVGGRLHCSFNLTGTRTGRLSASKPNLQQVPDHLHKLFIAGPGKKLLCYDLSGIEPVVIAYLTEDATLCDLLINGGNFHNQNTRIFFGLEGVPDDVIKSEYKKERDVAKETGLAILYGAGPRRLQESTNRRAMPFSFVDCRYMVRKLKEEYKEVWDFKQALDKSLETEPMTNLLGRKLAIANTEDIYMKGFNTLVQSSASDMLLEAARKATEEWEQKDINATAILFVHDEVVVEVDEAQAEEAKNILLKHLTGYRLETKWGLVPVTAEGGIYDYWKK